MKNIISIKNLCYQKNSLNIIDNISLDVCVGEFVCISGPSGSGKSSLVKLIAGVENASIGSLLINGKKLNKSSDLDKIGLVYEEYYSLFTNDGSVYDKLFSILNKKNFSTDEIIRRIETVSRNLRIKNILHHIPNSLSAGNKQLILLAATLLLEPEILIIDDSLDMMDGCLKEKVLSMLKNFQKKNKLTILYVTQDIDDVLYADRLILMSNGKICLDKKVKDAFHDEKIFTNIGLSFPFTVNLSKKLQYYDLVDKLELNMDKLVNVLWK